MPICLYHTCQSIYHIPYTCQSAYTKFYSTETTLLSLHDHVSNAISMQQVSCLCLLDLSTAFGTLDHSILLRHLSTWFGIFSVSLQRFTSYLSSRTSTVGIPAHSFPSSPLIIIIFFLRPPAQSLQAKNCNIVWALTVMVS